MMEFDVVVIGGGIAGGIPAAAYLQKAGARVALVDGRQELGAFIPTHEILPNVITSPHAGGNWSGSSPAWEDLDLEEYGHRLVVGAVSVGNTNVDGRNLFFSPQRIARFSEKDAARAAKILGGVMSNIVELNELIYYSIPRPDKLETIWNLMASIWGIPAADFSSMNAFELLESTFESPEVRMLFISVPAAQNLGDIATPGQGAFTVVAALGITGGQAIGGNHTLAHAMLRIFLKHGGTILRSCPVKKIIVENGIAKGVLLSPKAIYPGQEVRARHAVISNVGACLTLELVGEQTVAAIDPKLAAKMKHWDMASRASTVTIWVTNGFPKWKSRHWDPMIEKAHFFYGVGWESWEGVKQWYRALRNNDLWGAFGRFGEMVIPAAVDPSQMSPEGYVSIRCEEVLPFWWQGEGAEPDLWDDAKDAMLEKRTDFLEQLAPGFKEQVVEAIHCTPLDVWRYNPSGVHGNGIGGAFTSEQWMFDRMPYRMPIKALYSSNSVWPASMSYMASGYNAACVVAEDMGIRKQPWWVHRPVEWFLKNRARLAARP